MAQTISTVAIVSIVYIIVLFFLAARAMKFVAGAEQNHRRILRNEFEKINNAGNADESVLENQNQG